MISISVPLVKQYLWAYSPPFFWAVFIFILSAQDVLPSFELSTIDFIFKKLSHIFVYAVLYFLLNRAVNQSVSPATATKHWYLPLLLTAVYALTDEFHQQFVPGRYGTLRDTGYDLLGALIVFMRQYRYIWGLTSNNDRLHSQLRNLHVLIKPERWVWRNRNWLRSFQKKPI